MSGRGRSERATRGRLERSCERLMRGKLQAALAGVELRLQRNWEETVRTRVRVLRLEGALSARPELRELIAAMPGPLRERPKEKKPFPQPVWSVEEGGGGGGEALEATPTGAGVTSRVRAAVGYLRAHPQVAAAEAARRFRLALGTVYASRAYKDLCVERGEDDVRHARRVHYSHTGAVQRALEYVAKRRPKSMNEVALAVNTSRSNLAHSTRFQVAWREYRTENGEL